MTLTGFCWPKVHFDANVTTVCQVLGVGFEPRSSQDSRVSCVWREALGWLGPPRCTVFEEQGSSSSPLPSHTIPSCPTPTPPLQTLPQALPPCGHSGGSCGTGLPTFLEGSGPTLVTSRDLDCPLPKCSHTGVRDSHKSRDTDIQPTVVCALPVFGTERPIGNLSANQDLTWQVARSSQILGKVLALVWGCVSICGACWEQPVFRSQPGRAGGCGHPLCCWPWALWCPPA